VPTEEWKRYPAIRKLEFAYRAAEKVRSGQGKDVLAFVAQNLVDINIAVVDDLQLKSLLAVNVDPSLFEFARGPPLDDWPALPIELRQQVYTLARYANRSIVGSTYDVLVTILKIDSDRAYELLANSSSHEEALQRGFASLSSERRTASMRLLTEKIAEHTDAIYDEPSLVDYLPHKKGLPPIANIGGMSGGPSAPHGDGPNGPSGTGPSAPHGGQPTGPSGNGPPASHGGQNGPNGDGPSAPSGGVTGPHYTGPSGPHSGGGGAAVINPAMNRGSAPESPFVSRAPVAYQVTTLRAAEIYGGFVKQEYETIASRAFATMSESIAGFGGVVFGNTVTGPSTIKEVKSIRFEAEFQQSQGSHGGRLCFALGNGKEVFLSNVDSDTVAVASRILFGPPAGLAIPSPVSL
jgi:hypothetical protein